MSWISPGPPIVHEILDIRSLAWSMSCWGMFGERVIPGSDQSKVRQHSPGGLRMVVSPCRGGTLSLRTVQIGTHIVQRPVREMRPEGRTRHIKPGAAYLVSRGRHRPNFKSGSTVFAVTTGLATTLFVTAAMDRVVTPEPFRPNHPVRWESLSVSAGRRASAGPSRHN